MKYKHIVLTKAVLSCLPVGMAKLITDYIKIAQVGPSVDGRFIRDDWIRDMAATYAPATYTAMLWPDHLRWFGNFGEVVELKDGPDETGVYSLFARLAPNRWFLEHNANGQGLFYSIEVAENFAESGKTYLEGLGVTDSPASLGQRSTHFAKDKGTVLIGNVPFALPMPAKQAENQPEKPQNPQEPEEPGQNTAPGWFKKAFPFLFTSDNGADAPEKDTDNMDEAMEARIAALEDGLSALQTQLADISGRLAALEIDVEADGGGDSGGSDPAYRALARQFGSLRKDMAAFMSQVSGAVQAGTKARTTTGPAGGKGLL